MFYIYLIFNQINGKLYVGKSKDGNSRFRDHLKIARGGKEKYYNSYSYIHAALNKYGFDNFIIKTIEENILDETMAFSREKEWIAFLKNMGYVLYNLTDGGDGSSGHKMSEDGKMRLSQSKLGKSPWNKGKPTSDVTKNKQSIVAIDRFKKNGSPLKGKPSFFKGKKRSKDFGDKISEGKKGIPLGKEHVLALSKLTEDQVKNIRSFIEQGMMNKDIAIMFGVHRDTISRIKNGKSWTK